MSLSKHFTLEELTHSQEAVRRNVDNTPPPEVVEQLERLCRLVLQPLRERLAVPIVVSSGYRNPRVNRMIGGAINSLHVLGRAADIIVPSMNALSVCQMIRVMQLPYDELIYEGTWTHVGVARDENNPQRKELTAHFVNGMAQYSKGIA